MKLRSEKLKLAASLLGFGSETELIIKYVLPILGLTLTASAILNFIPIVPKNFIILLLVLGIAFVPLYPVMIFEKKRNNINENLHFFITYAGTISTMKIGRGLLFRRIAQKRVFGELSIVAEKIFYLSKRWNLGFAKTCRKIGRILPSKILSDFYDRFAVVMDFGGELETFLSEEQTHIMNDYASEYQKSLENIKTVQQLFVSLTVAIAFIMSISLLLPLVAGVSVNEVIKYSMFGMLFLDGIVFLLIKAFIPSDKIGGNLPKLDEDRAKLRKTAILFVIGAVILLTLLLIFTNFPFLVSCAIAFIPLIVIGFWAEKVEDNIKRRDLSFPVLIRTLGTAVEVRSGAMMSAMKSLRVHDFGLLNPMIIALYRRLRMGCDKIKSWMLFAAETGSNYINHFSKIFAESVYLGGSPEKIANIVSRNFQKILVLRNQRLHLAQGLKGAVYGSLLGFCAATYVTSQIAQILADLFTAPEGGAGGLGDILGDISPDVAQVDIGEIGVYIGIMVLVHSAISAIVLKEIDGGLKLAAFKDFVFMIILGAVVSVLIPMMLDSFLPNVGDIIDQTAETSVEDL